MQHVNLKEQIKKNILDHISSIYNYDVSCIDFLHEAKHQVLDVAEFLDSTLEVMERINIEKSTKKRKSTNSINNS